MIVFRLFLQFAYTVNFNMGSLPAELPAKNIYVYAKAIQRAGKRWDSIPAIPSKNKASNK